MSDSVNGKQVFSLLEVAQSIRKTLSDRYTSSFWVVAEMNKLNLYTHSGHCYPEMVEKKEGKITAELKAILWRDDYLRINNQFLQVLKEPLRNGIKILFNARISFDPVYGLSLIIQEIDPSFSLGELEREKQESLARLTKEGLIDRNKSIPFPMLPQRIAIISVETSKGYADFLSMTEGNAWNYRFFHMLFPALLQGEKAVPSIREQLKRIHRVKHHFDIVAIIRGGGGDVGLSCYNNYNLACDIALFPLPVLSGIGHATNETVAEIVANKNAITPTALAGYLIQCFHNYSVPVTRAAETVPRLSMQLIEEEKSGLMRLARGMQLLTQHSIQQGKKSWQEITASIYRHAGKFCRNENNRLQIMPSKIRSVAVDRQQQNRYLLLQAASGIQNRCFGRVATEKEHFKHVASAIPTYFMNLLKVRQAQLMQQEQAVQNLSPENILKRGFSITRVNGKNIQQVDTIIPGDELETILRDGRLKSTVHK